MTKLKMEKMQVFSACLVSFLCIIGGIFGRPNNGQPNSINCQIVNAFFDSKNMTIDFPGGQADTTSRICRGGCCNERQEEDLRVQAKTDFHSSIYHHSRTLQGLLNTTAEVLRESVTTLTRESGKQTLNLFERLYRPMASATRNLVFGLYEATLEYISPENTKADQSQVISREVLQLKFLEFFTKLFPIAYHRQINPEHQDFTQKFKDCLYDSMDEIQPFGHIPEQISESVTKAIEATRVLIQALTLGKSVLDKTDKVIFYESGPQQAACYDGYLRMNYCPKCMGYEHNVQPCAGLCTNILRGCLTEPATELDPVWSAYLDVTERLIEAVDSSLNPLGLNLVQAMKLLDTRISDAIMYSMENGPSIKEKVRKMCGRTELEPLSNSPPESEGRPGFPRLNEVSIKERVATFELPGMRKSSQETLLHSHLRFFLTRTEKSKTFYGTLADSICANLPHYNCWNGESIGVYTNTVVESSLTAQKYNPEFPTLSSGSTNALFGNSNTSVLIDQLRHVIQVIQSQLSSSPDTHAALADAVADGSGSGLEGSWDDKPHMETDDEDDANRYNEASGSGMGPSTIDSIEDTNDKIEVRVVGAAAALSINISSILALVTLLYHLS